MASKFVASVHNLSALPSLFKGTNFLTKYSPKSIPHPDPRIYNDPLHPMYKRCRESTKQRLNELLIYTKTTKAACTKYATVRRRCRRLVVEATRQVLRERGYHLDGRPLDKKSLKPKLTGTIMYIPVTEVITDPWPTILAEVTQAVNKFIQKTQTPEKPRWTESNNTTTGSKSWKGQGTTQKEQRDQGRFRMKR